MWYKNTIRLFWWNEVKLMHKSKENYGDLIGKYLAEKISGKKVRFAHPKKWNLFNYFKPIYVTVGSILAHVNEKCVVWGSGIILKEQEVKKAKFLAVRGPQTRKRLLNLGYEVPEIYGDPALLLPNYYHPTVEKKYEIGIIPHYNDYKTVKDWYKDVESVKVIDLMTLDIEHKTDEILSCKHIISSSLHGLIVAHAYEIPAVWVKFSDKLFGDGIKFQDYLESVGISNYHPPIREKFIEISELEKLFHQYTSLPEKEKVEQLKADLLSVCPFQ